MIYQYNQTKKSTFVLMKQKSHYVIVTHYRKHASSVHASILMQCTCVTEMS